jgi:predicted metal-dependent hydrolase
MLEPEMQVRTPNWDFSKVRAHWTRDHEFAQFYNASSTVPAYIEPYLVKVMVQAKAALDPTNEKLHRDLEIFIKQEIQHCKQHLRFNKALRDCGYEEILPLEKAYEADYNEFLEKKSLRFNCAYSEGFEAMSAIAVSTYFEEYDEYLKDADEEPAELWRWHLAEEHEHRTVAHDVYHALFGKNKIAAYFYRVWAFFYAVNHIRSHVKRVTETLLAKDRANMSPEEVAASKAREAEVGKVAGRRAREHLLRILSPFYDPRKRPEPRGVAACLARHAAQPVS